MLDQHPVSVIIPSFNTRDLLLACLESLKKFWDWRLKVIVVDNGSTDGTIEMLSKVERISIIQSGKNAGFAGACNLGIRATNSQYVVLANSDLLFTPNWLNNLLHIAKLNDRIGLVGPLTNKASGFQVEPFAAYRTPEEMLELAGRTQKKNFGLATEVPFLIFFCVLIKRQVIDAVGLLDESFGLGGCDDLDFCFRSNAAGYCSVIARQAFIHHECSQTYKANKMDYNALLIEARQRFTAKWGALPKH